MTDTPEPPRHPGQPTPPSNPTPPANPAPNPSSNPAPPPGQSRPPAQPNRPAQPSQPSQPAQPTRPTNPAPPSHPGRPQQPPQNVPPQNVPPSLRPPSQGAPPPARPNPAAPTPPAPGRPAPTGPTGRPAPVAPNRVPPAGAPPMAPTPTTTPANGGGGGGGGKGKWIAGGVLVGLLGLGGIGVAVSGGGEDDDAPVAADTTIAETTETTVAEAPETTVAETTDTPAETPTDEPPSVQDLARATVQILTADANGFPVCVGSGSIISEGGRILTNAHVIDPSPPCGYDQILVAITTDTAQVPDITYRADVLSVDVGLDLAVLQIAERLDGGAVETSFPTIEVGDSDTVQLGDPLRIFGYPTIGGETITFTNGSVSGFTQTAGNGDRAWIKTDATIAGGNSGGAAVNAAGQLVGVPTQASAGDNTDIVDCRVLTDTNGDGVVNDLDQCVPIGGFINGIRPVALAAPIIAEADSAEPQRVFDGGFDTSSAVGDVALSFPQWSSGIVDDLPADDIYVGVAGQTELCFSFDYSGMVDGMTWSALWFVDGQFDESYSLVDITWNGGPEGIAYWVCALNDVGLAAGDYELLFQFEGETIAGEAITLLPPGQSPSELTFVNDTGETVCFLAFSSSWASYYGLDELREDILEAGASFVVPAAPGTIDVRAFDCDVNVLAELSVDIPGDGSPVTASLS